MIQKNLIRLIFWKVRRFWLAQKILSTKNKIKIKIKNKIKITDHPEFMDLRCHFENCTFEAENISELNDHYPIWHNGEESFVCGHSVKAKTCNFAAPTEREVTIHRGIRHWTGAVHLCQYCHKGYDQKQSLLNHEFS